MFCLNHEILIMRLQAYSCNKQSFILILHQSSQTLNFIEELSVLMSFIPDAASKKIN